MTLKQKKYFKQQFFCICTNFVLGILQVEEKEEEIRHREEVINNQQSTIKRISDEFEQYRLQYSAEEFGKLKNELFVAMRRIEELDKINRETTICKLLF